MSGLRKPALLAEDGAVFKGHIQPTDDGRFQVSCSVALDYKSHYEEEEPVYDIQPTKEAARQWLHQHAGNRGFKTLFIDDSECA